MTAYLFRRLLLVIPTLFGIIAINFAVIQFAPGGPVEQMIAELPRHRATCRLASAAPAPEFGGAGTYRGARGLDPHIVADIQKMFGFDKPPLTRFLDMVGGYLRFDFGRSFFRDQSVLHLIAAEDAGVHLARPVVHAAGLPRSRSRSASPRRCATAAASTSPAAPSCWLATPFPSFLFAILLVVLFAGGSFLQWFPLRGLTSEGSADWSWPARIGDYAWHMVLPTVAVVPSGFASLTMLTKNCFLEEIRKQYTVTARAKGAGEQRVLYGHVFRNAMLLIVAGFPQAFIGILFTSALLVEIVFSLDGLGLLGFQSAIQRDYPVMFGTLYIFTLLGLLMQIVGDILYTVVDPRIDFEDARLKLSPITRRRLAIFRRHRRGYWSFWIFMVLFGI